VSACAEHGAELHAYDRYQNVTKHKTRPQYMKKKSTDMHNCNTESVSGKLVQHACHAQSVWLLHAHRSSTPCVLQDVSTLRWHSRRHAHQCGHWRGWSMWRVTSTVIISGL